MTTQISDPSSETPTRRQKMQALSSRFKLNSHYEIERFGIISLILIVILIAVVALAGVSAAQNNRASISDTAVYTTEFESSRTGQEGVVNGVYTNEAGTRALVLFTFDTAANMSSLPDDYEAYISGVNINSGAATTADTAMTGQIVSLGTTGTMGVLLNAPEGFEQQVLNITMAANKELVAGQAMEEEDRAALGYDESFTTRDQWRIVFNPAASQAEHLPGLDGETVNMRAVINDSMMLAREKEQRQALDASLQEMKVAQDRIVNLFEAAETTMVTVEGEPGVQLVPLMPPADIAGDQITGLSSEELTRALNEAAVTGEPVAELADKSDRARSVDTYADGYMPNTYELLTTSVVPGGFNFNWRDTTIGEGYLDSVIPAGQDPEAYLMEIARVSADRERIDASMVMLSNGRLLSDYEPSVTSVQPLRTLSNSLVQSYQNYYDAKSAYQRTELFELLSLEVQLNQIAASASVSSNADAVSINR